MFELSRRTFVKGAFAAGAVPCLAAGGARIARIGLMTDTHVETTLASCGRVRLALELFKRQGAEMVINCGDIADRHYPEGYRFYRQTVNEVYPEAATRPKEVFAYAYHDLNNFRPNSGWNIADAAEAFEHVRTCLQAPNPHTCDFVWKGLPFAVFPQATGQKGFLSWDDYEKTVARLCAAHPGKPVFVIDHVPPQGTTFHSWQWGSSNCRRILNKFPQVVSISGHVHGSMASERQIWQGEFTAVNLGCLQTWGGFASGSTPPHQAKPNWTVSVMDVYADRLEIARYDVRDGSPCGATWVVPLPFVPQMAPYRPSVAVTREPVPAFATGAAVTVTPSGSPVTGYSIDFDAATQGPRAFEYTLTCSRRTTNGGWEPFTRDDIFGDFWKAAKDRTGRESYLLDAGFFTPGEIYRVTVTPRNCFGKPSAPIFTTFTATHAVAKTLWKCADPRKELRFTEYGRPVPMSEDGWFAPPSGHGTLRLPENAFACLVPGRRHRLILDVHTVQPTGDWNAWRVLLRARTGGPSLAEIQTAPGDSGAVRYVLAFTPRAGAPATCDLLSNCVIPGGRLKVLGLRLEVV